MNSQPEHSQDDLNDADSDNAEFPPFVECVRSRRSSLTGSRSDAVSKDVLRSASGLVDDGLSEPAALPSPVLDRLGPWRIEREIGRGGMGIVYEAVHEESGVRAALKFLPSTGNPDPQRLDRFQHEARIIERLTHPNIVRLQSVEHLAGHHFLVMQLIDGISLDCVVGSISTRNSSERATIPQGRKEAVERLQSIQGDEKWLGEKLFGRGQDRFRFVATLTQQAAQALSYAHSQRVIHRDIKPSNLLVDRSDVLWITDFGLAQIQDEHGLTSTGDLLGTLRYMSPEQAMASRIPVDHRTDVYSLGATLYELLSGRPAFAAEDRKELLRQVLFDEPSPLQVQDAQIPVPLQIIVEKAMQKDPRLRYSTAGEMADDLFRFLSDVPIRARRLNMPERLFQWVSRRRGLVFTATMTLLLLLVALLLMGQRHAAELKDQVEITKDASLKATRGQWDALMLQAQMGRSSNRPGRRVESLRAVSEAAQLTEQLDLSAQDRTALRTEAIAALALPHDIELLGDQSFGEQSYFAFLDPAFTRVARLRGVDGTIVITPVAPAGRTDGHDSSRLSNVPVEPMIVPGFGLAPYPWQFTADGRKLVVQYGQIGGLVCIWNVDPTLTQVPKKLIEINPAAGGFSSVIAVGDSMLAVCDSALHLQILNSSTLEMISTTQLGAIPSLMSFTSGDEQLAVGFTEAHSHLVYFDPATLKPRGNMESPGPLLVMLRDKVGGLLQIYEKDAVFRVRDANTTRPVMTVRRDIRMVDLAPQGDLLAVEDSTGTTELFDARTGTLNLRISGRLVGFSGDGHLLAICTTYGLRFYRVHRSRFVARLDPVDRTPATSLITVAFSSDGRWLAASGGGATLLYDAESMQLRETIRDVSTVASAFIRDADSEKLLISSTGKPLQVKVFEGQHWQDASAPLFPHLTTNNQTNHNPQFAVNADGTSLIRSENLNEAVVWHGDRIHRFPHSGMVWVAIHPSGELCVTGQFLGLGLKVWDVKKESLIQDLWPDVTNVSCLFSPDGRWLLASAGPKFRVWETASWKEVWTHARLDGSDAPAPIAFTSDSRQMLISPDHTILRLFSTESWDHLLDLTVPEPGYLGNAAFSPDGRWIARCTTRELYRWDWKGIQEELRKMGIE